jgi:glycosyltransferase involved in cell wall biosynthesis
MRIKIFIAGMYDNPGGIEKITFDYVSRIKTENIEFSFLNIYEKICYQDELEKIGCKIYSLPNPKRNIFLFIFEYMKLCKNEKFDIIHINMLSAANILPLLCAKICGCKNIIVHSHNGNRVGFCRHILHFINKHSVKLLANHYFSCSDAAAKFMFGNEKNIKIIRNAIDISKYKFDAENRKKIREKLNLPQNSLVIGHVGRFEKQKNHKFMIRVFKKISEKNANAILLLVGVVYTMKNTERLVKQLKLSDKVIFYGKSDDAAQIYSAMDLFLLPSFFEGLPIVGIEAQCNGLSMLASTGISTEMQITDLVYWLKLSDGEQKWADKAREILSKTYERNNYAEEVEKAGYCIKTEAEKLANLYKEIK